MTSLSERIKARRRKDRPMETINFRLPADIIEDLKEIAPTLGFSGYQPLMRAYIGRGLREDLFKLEDAQIHALTASLRSKGVSDEVIAEAMYEPRIAASPKQTEPTPA